MLLILAIWLAPDAAPLVSVPIWLVFFPPKQKVSPESRRMMLVLLGAGMAMFCLGVFAYITY